MKHITPLGGFPHYGEVGRRLRTGANKVGPTECCYESTKAPDTRANPGLVSSCTRTGIFASRPLFRCWEGR